MPVRPNKLVLISLEVLLYLSVFACLCTASLQNGFVVESTGSSGNSTEAINHASIRNHSFIEYPSDNLGGLLAHKTPAGALEEFSHPRFDASAMYLPEIDLGKNISLSLVEFKQTLKADCELMRSGRKEYFPDTFSRRWSMFQFIVHSFRIEHTMIRSAASLWFTDYLEASASMWAEGIGRTTRIDLKVTIRNIPLFKQARLVSRYFQVSSPRSMWHEPWLERGYKMNVGDISLSERRFMSNLELQFPDLLGGRGIVGGLSLDADRGLGLGFNIDLPNYTIPGTSFKLKLPDISFVLFH